MKITTAHFSVIMVKKCKESGLLDPEEGGTVLLQYIGNSVLFNTS
jgi:hypothetical protein